MNSSGDEPCAATWAAIGASRTLPVAPYVSAMPYSRKPLAKAPSRKYLSAASCEVRRCRHKPASTYTAIDMVSSPRKINTKSVAAAMTTMPSVANSSRA